MPLTSCLPFRHSRISGPCSRVAMPKTVLPAELERYTLLSHWEQEQQDTRRRERAKQELERIREAYARSSDAAAPS